MVVLLCFGTAVVLLLGVLAEVALRLAALPYSAGADPRCAGSDVAQATQKGLFQIDPRAGYTMRANLCVRLRTSEYDQVLRTNSRGLAGPEVPAVKPPGEFRIVVLGDSYTVGGQVSYEQTFPARLEQELQARGYSQARVINAGVGGYTTFNEAGLLRDDLSWMQPDLVIVAAFLGNDVAENVLATAAGYTIDPDHPKGFSYGPAASELVQQSTGWFARNGDVVVNVPPPPWDSSQPLPSPAPSPAAPPVHPTVGPFPAWIFDPSPTITVKNLGHFAWDGARSHSLVLGAIFGQPPDTSISTEPGARPPSKDQRKLNLSSFEWTILREIPHTYWLDVAWPLFNAYLSDINATAASAGAHAMVLVIPQIGQVVPYEHNRTMADYRFSDAEVDWDRPQRDMATAALSAGLPVLDLLSEFRVRGDRDQLYLPLDQHFTALGHQVTAEILAQRLIDSGLLP